MKKAKNEAEYWQPVVPYAYHSMHIIHRWKEMEDTFIVFEWTLNFNCIQR